VARPARLPQGEVERRVAALPAWSLHRGRLHREFVFRDFAAAWAFMTEVAREAEALGHHPDWSNTYNRVTVDLVTHDAGGITELDFRLAAAIQALAGRV
jgi:4a-hydroxytetrahydrobiopterin dehydratase